MISYARFFVYLVFLCTLIFMGINNQQLRANVDILKGNIETYHKMIEIKNVMLENVERSLRTLEKVSAEREDKLEETNNKLKEAVILLEMVYDETEMPDSAYNVLRSLGIVREGGGKDRVCNNIQADNPAGAMDTKKGSSDAAGKKVQRPAEVEH